MCRKCQKYITFSEKVKSRSDLADITGEYFKKRCDKCGHFNQLHVNDVKAYESLKGVWLTTFIGSSIIAVVTIFFWQNGVVTNVGLIIGGLVILGGFGGHKATSNVTAFNKYRVQIRRSEN